MNSFMITDLTSYFRKQLFFKNTFFAMFCSTGIYLFKFNRINKYNWWWYTEGAPHHPLWRHYAVGSPPRSRLSTTCYFAVLRVAIGYQVPLPLLRFQVYGFRLLKCLRVFGLYWSKALYCSSFLYNCLVQFCMMHVCRVTIVSNLDLAGDPTA